VPAADFSADELLYWPRNPRPHKLYGMSPVEQVAMTVNIALRRDMATLDYYRLGSTPDAFATLPKDWTLDQIRQFQDYFDALMSGNSARRRRVKFMPSGFELRETRQPPLKDQYDEWLARVICYAFSIPPSPFVAQVNRATSESMRMQATQEGLVPLKAYVKSVLDQIVQVCLKQPDLEFAWIGDDAIDPWQQAQTLTILVNAGIKTRAEARAELGLPPDAKDLGKFNPYHDERGRFTTADGAAEGEGEVAASPARTPRADVQVAEIDSQLANPGVMSDASPDATTPNPDSYSGPGGTLEYVDARSAPSPDWQDPGLSDLTTRGLRIAQRIVADALETLGSDAAAATLAVASAILIASTTSVGDPNVGVAPGRPDISFEWNPTTGKIQFFLTNQNGQTGRTLIAQGRQRKFPGVFLDSERRLLALEVKDSGGYVFANLGLLDEAVAAVRSPGEPPRASGDSEGDLQVFYNPDTKEVRVAPVGANSDGTLAPGFIAAWTILSDGGRDDTSTPRRKCRLRFLEIRK
jgi:hypothetical protein